MIIPKEEVPDTDKPRPLSAQRPSDFSRTKGNSSLHNPSPVLAPSNNLPSVKEHDEDE